jgi:AcrR family transcriptional regulator
MAYRPTAKTEARKAAQHQQLLEAAIHLVNHGGFAALTIQAVAQQAGIATGTVYKYFKDKASLSAEVFKRCTVKEVEQVRLATHDPAHTSIKERLHHSIGVFAERAIQGRRLAYALIAEPVDALVDAERLIYRKAYADIWQELIEEGMASGECSPQIASVSAAALVGVVAESLVGPLAMAEDDRLALEKDKLIEAIQGFCWRAISGSK